MKTTIKTIVLAAASLFAAMSCQKEESGMQDLVKEGETIQVSINAGLGDFVAADGTKATAKPVVRLTWENGDKVDAYYGETKISGDDDDRIKVIPSDNNIFAKLSGSITPQDGMNDESIITFVYSNLDNSKVSGLTFNFSEQDGTIPFVAYATVKYGYLTSNFSDKMVEFKFATSVMKIAATNLVGGEINEAKIRGINTKVKLSPSINDATANIVTGEEEGTITITAGIDASSDKTRAIFTVGLVPEDVNSNRKLTINGREADITSNEIKASKSYTTPCAFEEAEFVIFGTTKWATKNLGADKVEDYGKLYSWGNLAGQRGDDNFYPGFTEDNYESTEGHSINDNDYTWTKTKHDAAYNEWGGSWRMPTKQDFVNLAAEGVWFWTSDYKSTGKSGCIVYVAQHRDDKGIANMNGTWKKWNGSSYEDGSEITGRTYSVNTVEHIFFPAAGYSLGTSRADGGNRCYYWSSSLNTDDTDEAYNLFFFGSAADPQNHYYRYCGMSVRPVQRVIDGTQDYNHETPKWF